MSGTLSNVCLLQPGSLAPDVPVPWSLRGKARADCNENTLVWRRKKQLEVQHSFGDGMNK